MNNKNMKILGLIPARGGSKGIPKKNIKILGDKPLIAYTIEAAQKSKKLMEIVVSSDSQEIADIASQYGASVPFLRPEEFAQDTTPMIDVLIHTLEFFKEKEKREFDAVCLLQPTTPFRKSEDIDGCIKLMEENDADSVITTIEMPHQFNPYWVYFKGQDKYLHLSTEGQTTPRRQDLPIAYARAGSVYLTKSSTILEKRSVYGNKILNYNIDTVGHVNIDTLDDWVLAEKILKEKNEFKR